MNSLVCASCRASLRKASRTRTIPSIRTYSTPDTNPKSQESTPETPEPQQKQTFDIGAFLSKPSWSVRSLLPDPNTPLKEEITPKQLHHLLRLSALPQPKSPKEEAEMLKTLHTQLHFVRDIQSVDTEGVEPLQSIRDETTQGIKEATIELGTLEGALKEEVLGKRNRRPRRAVKGEVLGERGDKLSRKAERDRKKTPLVHIPSEYKTWDVMASANDKIVTPNGSYFVVRSGKAESPVKADLQGRKVEQHVEGNTQEPEKGGESPP